MNRRPYPAVVDEFETLAEVCAGRSLARYGDGEFKICMGGACVSQRAEAQLTARLRRILHRSGECLVGIPRLASATPKRAFWDHCERYTPLLAERLYWSAFITRPDSAPWIDVPQYWAQLESLWIDRPVTLVRGSTKSLTADLLQTRGAGPVREIIASRHDAYHEYDELLDAIGRPARALLCLGPTATLLAVDLTARGVHAIDCGHVGMFLRKRVNGEPLIVTATDRAVDKAVSI